MTVLSAQAEPDPSRNWLALTCAGVAVLGSLVGCAPRTASPDPAVPAMVAHESTRVASLLDSGTIRLHYIEHAIGSEHYTLHHDGDLLILADTFRFVDRGGEVALGTTLSMTPELEPRHFRTRGQTYRFTHLNDDIIVRDGSAHIRTTFDSATVRLPDRFFTVHGYAPFMVQALLVRYWERHGRPARLATIPGEPVADVTIEFRGIDTLRVGESTVRLRRYAVSNVAWGREALWLDEDSRFAAALSRASLLPFEGVREDLADLLPALQRIAVRDRMADLARMADALPPLASGTFAITGANLIDGTGAPALADAVILVRDGSIVAAGPRDSVTLPAGVRVFAVDGRTVIPGLWDMHGHFGQIEWGPALLAAGITTGRDMGGESEFLIAFRDALRDGQGIGPQLLLAGLVDGSGPAAFGSTWADSPEAGVAVVDSFHAAGFDQIKLYTLLQPAVVQAIISRAHALGMTVTGHIPRALTLEQAVTMGLDHVAHLPISGDPGDSETQRIIALLTEHGTVIDPVLSWGELLSRSSDTPIESFQPGFAHAPWPVRAVYGSVRNETPPETVATRRQRGLDIVRALHNAGVPIVAGTDDGVPGHSLHRELELYVEAGMTPMDALHAATTVPATAMGIADRVGTIEAGRRADLVILDGNPLTDIANIRTGRWVVANGRLYETTALWRMAGFGN